LSQYIKSIKTDEEMNKDYKEALLYIIIDAWDCNNSYLGGKSRRRKRKTNKKKTRKAKKKTNKKKRKGNKKRKTRTRRRKH